MTVLPTYDASNSDAVKETEVAATTPAESVEIAVPVGEIGETVEAITPADSVDELLSEDDMEVAEVDAGPDCSVVVADSVAASRTAEEEVTEPESETVTLGSVSEEVIVEAEAEEMDGESVVTPDSEADIVGAETP